MIILFPFHVAFLCQPPLALQMMKKGKEKDKATSSFHFCNSSLSSVSPWLGILVEYMYIKQ